MRWLRYARSTPMVVIHPIFSPAWHSPAINPAINPSVVTAFIRMIPGSVNTLIKSSSGQASCPKHSLSRVRIPPGRARLHFQFGSRVERCHWISSYIKWGFGGGDHPSKPHSRSVYYPISYLLGFYNSSQQTGKFQREDVLGGRPEAMALRVSNTAA